MALPTLRSPVARAVVPVVAGVVVLALIGAFLWLMAAFISSGDAETSDVLAPTTFRVGPTEVIADEIEATGPLLFSPPGIGTGDGEQSIVLDHEGDLADRGWVVYAAHPADRPTSCAVEQVRESRTFVDCDGRELDVTELAPPTDGVRPIVQDDVLELDLRGVTDTTVSTGDS